jgi:hypothetical protein
MVWNGIGMAWNGIGMAWNGIAWLSNLKLKELLK